MSNNELKSTPVRQSLDKKMLIMGFEIPDLLFIFLTISTLNFFFGTSELKWLLVWKPSSSIANFLMNQILKFFQNSLSNDINYLDGEIILSLSSQLTHENLKKY